MSLKIKLLILAAILIFFAWLFGLFEQEDWTEASYLYYGDGVYVSPEEHERGVALWSKR